MFQSKVVLTQFILLSINSVAVCHDVGIISNFRSLVASNCSAASSSCSSCIKASSNCVWCTTSSICIAVGDGTCSDSDQVNTCDDTYYTIIFVCVLSVLMCICCGACYMKKYRADLEGLRMPLIPQIQRSQLFRDSLGKSGESEWMCIICGFDNHPRNKHCKMCGTDHDFSKEYKAEKLSARLERKKIRELMRKEKKLYEISIDKDKQLKSEDLFTPTKEISGSTIEYLPATIPASPNKAQRLGLTAEKRRDALNYRRLNQLSLRQKSARRRKTWQRVVDDFTGDLKWVRVSLSDVRINNAPFGYTPRQSIADSDGSSVFSGAYRGSNGSVGSGKDSTNRTHVLESAVKGQRNDSFGDVITNSPGFTTVFDTNGTLNWEKVETGIKPAPLNLPDARSSFECALQSVDRRGSADPNPMLIQRSSVLDINDPYANLSYPGSPHSEIEEPMSPAAVKRVDDVLVNDLEYVASLTFKEKLLWFLTRIDALQRPWTEGFVRLEIRREHILDDSVATFGIVDAAELHKWMRVQFIGEPGVDAGGLEREWFEIVTNLLLSPESGFFICSASDGLSGCYHINPTSGLTNPRHLLFFRFAGRLFGKAIMEQQSSKATLSLPLRKQILTMPISFSDLEFVDIELYRNLVWLQRNDNVEALELDFTVSYNCNGRMVVYELKPDGANIPVNDSNKEEYLELRLRHRMLDSIKPQLEAMLFGLYEVIPPHILSIFDYHELELLMCGIPEIDLNDWISHTEYIGEYRRLGDKHKIIKWFWKTVESWGNEERVRLLQFVTGCSRLPSQGFKLLQSSDGNYRKFNIQSIGKKDSIYPRAHTCFNKLDLPMYDSEKELEAYLSIVISLEVTGFSME